MSNTGTTADFAAFSGEVERGLFSTVHGRGAYKPVAFQPILRDDSAPHRWHGKPQALLEQIMRGVRALGDGRSVPRDLHQLSLCYLQELDSEQPAPDWAVTLGVTKNADSPPSPDLSQALCWIRLTRSFQSGACAPFQWRGCLCQRAKTCKHDSRRPERRLGICPCVCVHRSSNQTKENK